MKLFKQIDEAASGDHVRQERTKFEECIKCLKELEEFVNQEKIEIFPSNNGKKDYESIARKSRVLVKELEKHLESYE